MDRKDPRATRQSATSLTSATSATESSGILLKPGDENQQILDHSLVTMRGPETKQAKETPENEKPEGILDGAKSDSLARKIAPWALTCMAVLWGSTFFSIKRIVDHIPVSDFLAVRFLISGIVLAAVFHKSLRMTWRTFIHGLVLGVLWAVAQLLQTHGLSMTSASISGFVTGLYVVFTPVIAWVMFRSKLRAWTWVAVGLATVGLAALTLRPTEGGTSVGLGEVLTIACAVMYAVHIVIMGRWSTPEEAGALSIGQVLSMTVVFFIAAAPGGIELPSSIVDWVWMIYLAVLCGAVTLLIQTWAQGLMDATKAAVIMCSEPLWATFFAILFGGERPGWMFALGAAAILGAMYLVIRPPQRRSLMSNTSATQGIQG